MVTGFEDETSVISNTDIRKAADQINDQPRSPCLVLLSGSLAGQVFRLKHGETLLGRAPDAGIRLENEGVSRHHAKILMDADNQCILKDLASTNGTFINGEKIDERELVDGDRIQLGAKAMLKFGFQDSFEEDFQKRQYESATRDPLTACYNKRFFMERFTSEVAFTVRQNKPLSLVMIDLDHFKHINDTYGHLAGDFVLKNAASIMMSQIRTEDLMARYGGEEFVLIMRDTLLQPALLVAERMREAIAAAAFVFEGSTIAVTISLGVATWKDEPATPKPEDLIQKADALLYQAKRNGRNRTEHGWLDSAAKDEE